MWAHQGTFLHQPMKVRTVREQAHVEFFSGAGEAAVLIHVYDDTQFVLFTTLTCKIQEDNSQRQK